MTKRRRQGWMLFLAGLLLLAGAWLLLRLLPGLDTTLAGGPLSMPGGGLRPVRRRYRGAAGRSGHEEAPGAPETERDCGAGRAQRGHWQRRKSQGVRRDDLRLRGYAPLLRPSWRRIWPLTLVMVAVYLFIQFYSLWWRFKLEKEM